MKVLNPIFYCRRLSGWLQVVKTEINEKQPGLAILEGTQEPAKSLEITIPGAAPVF